MENKFESLENAGEDWFNYYNKLLLQEILKSLPGGAKVLEIGSWLGRSASFMLETNPNIDLHCLDLWEDHRVELENRKAEGDKTFNMFLDNMSQLGLLEKIKVTRDTSVNVLNYFEENSFDLIYIDGCHEEEIVYQDLQNSFKLIKLGGHIVGDDWNWNSVSKGIMRAYWDINAEAELLFPLRTIITVFHTRKVREGV